MRRFIRFLLFLFVLYGLWSVFGKYLDKADFDPVSEKLKSEISAVQENPDVSAAIGSVYAGLQQLAGQLDKTFEQFPQKQQPLQPKQVEKPNLETPTEQAFSIYNVELGDAKDEVEKNVGAAKRSSYNEYGVDWYAYHEDYQNFMMAAYDKNNKVAGLYTNQDLIASTSGIKLGSPKEMVLKQLGEPLTKIQKGMVYYQFEENRGYDVFLLDDSYVTIFYDKHQSNTVTAIQIISKELEQNKKDFYTQSSQQLEEGFEYQLFDLTNAARVKSNLQPLTWDENVNETARNHSKDMADKNYFDHTNPKGQSPFDRMQEDKVAFTVAGENLSYGQNSSIFAHEGLMNSLGHRGNILRKEFENLGVGVAFNSNSQPYYTENFYTD